MDEESHVVINILKDVVKNVDLLWRMSQVVTTESIEDRFYRYVQNPTSVHVPAVVSGGEMPDELRVVERFARLVMHKISSGETVDGPALRLEKLELECAQKRQKVAELEMTVKKVEADFQQETQLRLQLIEDLQTRLRETKERTVLALRLAKECGEAARREWELKYQKPREEQRLYHDMLSARLAKIIHDNATIEAQLLKCRDERSNEVALITIKMEQDIQERRAELAKLRTEVSVETEQLKELEEELAAVTIEYDAIMAQRKKEADEAIQRRLEEKLQERSVIKIQRWWRFYLFRTMRSRRRRKKGKKKTSVPKKNPLDKETKSSPVRNEKEEEEQRDPSVEPFMTAPQTPVATVLVSRKSANARKVASSSEPLDPSSLIKEAKEEAPLPQQPPPTAYSTSKSSKTSGTKPSGTAIRVSFKKPGMKIEAEAEVKKEVISNSVTRSSQTDNRVPKSKQVYRPTKV